MRVLLFAASLLCLSVAAQAADPRAEIDAANRAFVATFARRDAAAMAALYTEKAKVLPPGSDLIQGRDAIRAFWQAVFDSGLQLVSLNTLSVDGHGNALREVGRIVAEVPDAQKAMTRIEGKYVVFWRRVRGAWKLDTDIWNYNR